MADKITDEARAILEGKLRQSTIGPADLLKAVELYIRRYVVLPPLAYLPVALWAIATHAVQTFECFPYVALMSAAKRSGKTRLAEVLETFVRRPWRGTAPSVAALYRMLLDAPTLMLDETEPLNAKNKSETTLNLLAILNMGHRKGGMVPRCEGHDHHLKYFPVYGPKLFAAIGHLPDTLLDRSIVIHMQRRTKEQKVDRFRQDRIDRIATYLRDKIVAFVQAYHGPILRTYQEMPDEDLDFLNDRDADVWNPLFTLCTVLDETRIPDLRTCAVVLCTAKAEEDENDSLSLTLLRDIRNVWPEETERYETVLLLEKLWKLEESPWKDFALTPRKLAYMLRPFEVKPCTIRVGERTPKGYVFSEFKMAFSRYLEDLSATSATTQ